MPKAFPVTDELGDWAQRVMKAESAQPDPPAQTKET
jgi:hypothetical protein